MTKQNVHRVARIRNEIYDAATSKFGVPNARLTNKHELRFGRKGSKRVDPDSGYYQDFQTGECGYLVQWMRPSQLNQYRITPKSSDGVSPVRGQNNANKIRLAKRIFEEATPINGTLAENYLKFRRNISLSSWPNAIRFSKNCPRRKSTAPALVAELRNIHKDKPIAIQRIFIDEKDSTRDGPRMMLGPSKFAVCKLINDSEVTNGLGIAEGIETALSILSISWAPVWAVLSAGGIERFPLLSGVEVADYFC